MFIGQDKTIFKHSSFLSKMWIGPNGERPLLPKDEGAGVMINSFICRESGLIQHLNEATLKQSMLIDKVLDILMKMQLLKCLDQI